MNGHKDIENRSWSTKYRGPILIHAGMSEADMLESDDIEILYGTKIPDTLEFGGVIGVVEVSDCRTCHASPWYIDGNYAWVLSKPHMLPFRPCKGALGLFRPNIGDAGAKMPSQR